MERRKACNDFTTLARQFRATTNLASRSTATLPIAASAGIYGLNLLASSPTESYVSLPDTEWQAHSNFKSGHEAR